MKLSLLYEFVNRETIVFHSTSIKNLPSIIKNGLGGKGKMMGELGLVNPASENEYVSRYLFPALEYAQAYFSNSGSACIIALKWIDTSDYEFDDDAEVSDPYYASCFVAKSKHLQVMFAWKYDEVRIPKNYNNLFGISAINWLDKHFDMIYSHQTGKLSVK